MDRRKALGNIGKGIGTIIVTPSIVSIFQRCQSSITFNPTFFKSEDFNLISRLMEIIIPKTDIPGAIELKLPEFVDNYIDAVWDKKSKENINKSLKLFKDVAKTKFGQKPTRDLRFDELDKLLDKFLKSKDINSEIKIIEGTKLYLQLLHQDRRNPHFFLELVDKQGHFHQYIHWSETH